MVIKYDVLHLWADFSRLMGQNKKLILSIGLIAAFLVLTSQVCYYQLQDTIKISAKSIDNNPSDDNSSDDKSVNDITEITLATSAISTIQTNTNPLFIIGDTYIFIKSKFENIHTRIEKGFNYFKILTHCIVPINAP